MDDRVERLSQRFKTLRTTIEELSDSDTAFAVCSVAYLEAIEYGVLQGLRRVAAEFEGPGLADPAVRLVHASIKSALKAYHRELCLHLGVDQAEIIQRSASFKELVDDICNQRG